MAEIHDSTELAQPQVPQPQAPPAQGPDHVAPQPGGEPRGNPAVRWLTVLLGLLLLGLAGVIGRDLWYRYRENDPQNSWIRPVFEWLGGAAVNPVGTTVGIIVALVGLWLLITALMPRPRTHMQVASPSSIWVRPVDVARKATASARSELGRSSISSKATRKKLVVDVEDDGTGHLDQRLAATLTEQVQRLNPPPHVKVNIHQPEPVRELQ